jgi:hypothetical protein
MEEGRGVLHKNLRRGCYAGAISSTAFNVDNKKRATERIGRYTKRASHKAEGRKQDASGSGGGGRYRKQDAGGSGGGGSYIKRGAKKKAAVTGRAAAEVAAVTNNALRQEASTVATIGAIPPTVPLRAPSSPRGCLRPLT